MALISSTAWTGRADDVGGRESIVNKRSAFGLTAPVAVLEREPEITPEPRKVLAQEPAYVPTKYKPVNADIKAYSEDQLREYSEVAEVVGVAPADLVVEQFKAFLVSSGITVFALSTVVSFMDQKSKDEGKGWGWNWRPLREKDRGVSGFGTEALRDEPWGRGGGFAWIDDGSRSSRAAFEQAMMMQNSPARASANRPASDHYSSNNGVYDKIVPLHALKKVAVIEKGFKHPVSFMVSDYAPAPAFRADPFLMAVVQNSRLGAGEGRFVIDVWDEPGFGIEQMLKSDLA